MPDYHPPYEKLGPKEKSKRVRTTNKAFNKQMKDIMKILKKLNECSPDFTPDEIKSIKSNLDALDTLRISFKERGISRYPTIHEVRLLIGEKINEKKYVDERESYALVYFKDTVDKRINDLLPSAVIEAFKSKYTPDKVEKINEAHIIKQNDDMREKKRLADIKERELEIKREQDIKLLEKEKAKEDELRKKEKLLETECVQKVSIANSSSEIMSLLSKFFPPYFFAIGRQMNIDILIKNHNNSKDKLNFKYNEFIEPVEQAFLRLWLGNRERSPDVAKFLLACTFHTLSALLVEEILKTHTLAFCFTNDEYSESVIKKIYRGDNVDHILELRKLKDLLEITSYYDYRTRIIKQMKILVSSISEFEDCHNNEDLVSLIFNCQIMMIQKGFISKIEISCDLREGSKKEFFLEDEHLPRNILYDMSSFEFDRNNRSGRLKTMTWHIPTHVDCEDFFSIENHNICNPSETNTHQAKFYFLNEENAKLKLNKDMPDLRYRNDTDPIEERVEIFQNYDLALTDNEDLCRAMLTKLFL